MKLTIQLYLVPKLNISEYHSLKNIYIHVVYEVSLYYSLLPYYSAVHISHYRRGVGGHSLLYTTVCKNRLLPFLLFL